MSELRMHILADELGVFVGVLQIDRTQLTFLGHTDGRRDHMHVNRRLIVAIGVMQERPANQLRAHDILCSPFLCLSIRRELFDIFKCSLGGVLPMSLKAFITAKRYHDGGPLGRRYRHVPAFADPG